MRMIHRYLLLAATLLVVAVTPAAAGEIAVSAAASLKDALTEITEIYLKKNPGVKFACNFGASGTLAQQLENGAPSDIYISASAEWMDYLKGKGVLEEGSIRPLARNTLVFVAGSQTKANTPQDLIKLERIALGSPKSVPAGAYAMQALRKAGLAKQLENRLVLTRDVRESLLYAERGEVDGAFVYRSDALLSKNLSIRFTVPSSVVPRIVYPMAVTVKGGKVGEAVQFFRFLQGGTAKAVLAKYGFTKN